MRIQQVAATLFVAAGTLAAQYQWDFTQNPLAADSSHWTPNGSVTFGSPVTTFSSSAGGSLIYNQTVSGNNPNEYDLDTAYYLTSGGGAYVQLVEASPGALAGNSGYGETCAGNYVSLEIDVPSSGVSPNGTLATVNIYQCSSGNLTWYGYWQASVTPVTTTRTVVWGGGNHLWFFVNNQLIVNTGLPYGPVGNPGIGGYNQPSGSGFASARIGHLDTLVPNVIDTQSIGLSTFPNQISMQWAGTTDDVNGIGLWQYWIYRADAHNNNWVFLGSAPSPEFTDNTVSAGSSYTYQITAVDWHGNQTPSSNIAVTIPPLQNIDQRRTGVRPLGNYWGGAGEQIDMSSLNLNFTIPLLTAQGRGNWSVPFNLTYNSQNWRQDGGGTWKLGYDVGYGFAWQLLAGAVTPSYTGSAGVDHYVFTDATGAQYRLTNNNNGVWSSTEGIYVWFDADNGVLHFRDGSSWRMGCVSGGTEADAGTMYPTVMYDANGNEIEIAYMVGSGMGSHPNTSARIYTIKDVRGKGSPDYWFTYNTDSTPHLTQVVNFISTPEAYQFSIGAYNLASPFSPSVSYGQTAVLNTLTNTALNTYRMFSYDNSGSGELISATMPDGGTLRWSYQPFTYVDDAGGRTYREVWVRYLGPWQYEFWHIGETNNSVQIHGNTQVQDQSGALKQWLFYTPGSQSLPGPWAVSLASAFQNLYMNGTVGARDVNYTWTTDPAGNPYISQLDTILDDQTSNAAHMRQAQTRDQYGNVTSTSIYDYGSLSTPIQTWTNTYLHAQNSAYDTAYLRNLLVSSSTTDNNGHTATLITNTYDGTAPATVSGGTPTEWLSLSGNIRGNLTQSVSLGQTTTYTYDVTGHQISASNQTSGTGASATYSSSTNWAAPDALSPIAGTGDVQNGHLAMQVSGSALQNGYSYNSALSLVNTTMPNSATTSQSFSSPTGLLTSSTSVNGATTTYSYTFNPTVVTATTNSHWAKSYRDGFGREIANETGYGSTVVAHTDTVYGPCACSPLGKVMQVSQPYGITGSTQITSDGTGTVAWTTYAYDTLGRTTSVTGADGSVTQYGYTGNTVTVTDPAGKWKTYTTNALGQLAQVIEPKPSTDTTGNPASTYVTTYTYDIEGHLISVDMPRPTSASGAYRQTRTFTYDLTTGQLLSTTNPENGTVAYTYFADGRLKSRTDAQNQTVAYSYDGYGRVINIDRYVANSAQPDPCQSVVLGYDTNGLATVQNPYGHLTYAEWGLGNSCIYGVNAYGITEYYGYTIGGQLAEREYYVDQLVSGSPAGNFASTFDTKWSYDNEGHNTGYTVEMPEIAGALSTFQYTMDQMDRPVGMVETTASPNTTWVKNVSYGPSNELQSMQMLAPSSGQYYTESRSYNNRIQLVTVSASGPNLQGINLSYSYNSGHNNGKVSGVADALSGEEIVYHYDELNRLMDAETTQATGVQWGQAFTYDGFGNLLTKGSYNNLPATTMNLTVNPVNNQITSYSYNANGDRTTSFDIENRTGAFNGAYDLENRVMFNSSTNEWVSYGINGERLATYQVYGFSQVPGTNNWTCDCVQTSRNVWFGGRLIQSKGKTVLVDRMGSVRANESGETFEYLPYGEEVVVKNPQDREKFATYPRTSFQGWDYAVNRWYDSVHGVFVSPDPSGGSMVPSKPASWNRYAYVSGDPVNSIDPTGLDSIGNCTDANGNIGWFQWADWDVMQYCIADTDPADNTLINPPAPLVVDESTDPNLPDTDPNPADATTSVTGNPLQPTPLPPAPTVTGPGLTSVVIDLLGNVFGAVVGIVTMPSIGGGSDEITFENNNQRENEQFRAAVRKYEKKCGITLDKNKLDRLHRAITKKGYTLQEIVEEAEALFGCPGASTPSAPQAPAPPDPGQAPGATRIIRARPL